jgi:hypothetical protein
MPTLSVSLSASKITMMNADTTVLTWTTSGNPTSCVGTSNRNIYSVSGSQKQWNGSGFSKNVAGGTESLDLYAGSPWWSTESNELDYEFKVECQFSSGPAISDSVTVKVLNPALSFDSSLNMATYLETSGWTHGRLSQVDPIGTTPGTYAYKFELNATQSTPDVNRATAISVPKTWPIYGIVIGGNFCTNGQVDTFDTYHFVYITKTIPGLGTQTGFNRIKQETSTTWRKVGGECSQTTSTTFTKIAP